MTPTSLKKSMMTFLSADAGGGRARETGRVRVGERERESELARESTRYGSARA